MGGCSRQSELWAFAVCFLIKAVVHHRKRDVVGLDSMHLLCFYCSTYQAVLWVDRSFRFFI